MSDFALKWGAEIQEGHIFLGGENPSLVSLLWLTTACIAQNKKNNHQSVEESRGLNIFAHSSLEKNLKSN